MPKLLDAKGRMFGLINPIDLVALLILLVVMLKLFTAWIPWPMSGEPCQINVDLLAQKVSPFLVQNIRVGQEILQDGSAYSLGTIQQKRVVPAEVLVERNGKLIRTQSNKEFDLWLRVGVVRVWVVKGSGRSGIYLGKRPLRVGQRLMLHTTTANLAGEVEAIRMVPDDHR